MSSLPVSLVVVASNEASTLPRMLRSAAPLCAEIVAVINNCTDDTQAILQEAGARVIERDWAGMAPQKQFALEQASQPWVLNLDADEEIPLALAEEIRAFVENDGHGCAGASTSRCTYFLGRWIRHGDWYPDRVVRLFRRDAGRFEGDRDHDHVVVDGPVRRLQADMHHYSNPTLNGQIAKINSFSDAFLRRKVAQGKRFQLSQALLRPPWRFVRGYLLRRGFLDGFPGFYAAVLTSFATFVRYSRLYEYEHDDEIRRQFSPDPGH